MLAEAARRYLNRYGVKVGERVVVATAHDSAYRAALDLAEAGVEVALDRRSRDERRRAAAGGGARGGAPSRGRRVDRRRARAGSASSSVAARRRPGRPANGSPATRFSMSGGWTPSVHLFSQSRGKLVFDEALQAFLPGVSAQRERSAGACNGDVRPRRRARGRRRGRARGARRRPASPRRRARPRPSVECAARLGRRARRAAARPRRPSCQGFRRFPERRLRQGHRARGAGGHALDRAHQALHHDRHGDRPGQALQHERARHRRRARAKADRRGRPDDIPPALYAGDFRPLRRRRARRSLRSHPPHADP